MMLLLSSCLLIMLACASMNSLPLLKLRCTGMLGLSRDVLLRLNRTAFRDLGKSALLGLSRRALRGLNGAAKAAGLTQREPQLAAQVGEARMLGRESDRLCGLNRQVGCAGE